MSAVGVESVDLVVKLDKEDLSTLNAFNLYFLLLTILQVDTGQVLDLEFSSHSSESCAEQLFPNCGVADASSLELECCAGKLAEKVHV